MRILLFSLAFLFPLETALYGANCECIRKVKTGLHYFIQCYEKGHFQTIEQGEAGYETRGNYKYPQCEFAPGNTWRAPASNKSY